MGKASTLTAVGYSWAGRVTFPHTGPADRSLLGGCHDPLLEPLAEVVEARRADPVVVVLSVRAGAKAGRRVNAQRMCLQHIALAAGCSEAKMMNSPIQAEGSNLRRVRRLSLGLLYLSLRLGGSLLDVERELHVVVVDANAIARLD